MNRPGIALVFALVIIAAVELLVISSLTLATHEAVIAEVRARTISAEHAADLSLKRVSASWPVPAVDHLLVGQSTTVNLDQEAAVTVQRTSWGTYYARARATAGRVEVSRSAVMRTLDVQRALTESSEAVVVAGPIIAPLATFGIDTASCVAPVVAERAPATITVSNRFHALGMREARIDSVHAVLPAGYAGAGLRWAELPGIADINAEAVLDLAEADSAAPIYPLVYSRGDLRVTGSGQGMLFTAGDLTLEPNTRFEGLISVRGTLNIGDGVVVRGAIRVHGDGPTMIGEASVVYSRCTLLRVLLESPASRRLIKAHRFYIPAF